MYFKSRYLKESILQLMLISTQALRFLHAKLKGVMLNNSYLSKQTTGGQQNGVI